MSQIKTKFLQDNAVSNAKLAQMPTLTLKGNNTGSTANAVDITVAQAQSMLGISSTTGDISVTSFSGANNQSSMANITGLAFANATVTGFEALVNVKLIATASLYETFKIIGVQRGADWKISYESVGDASGISFDITNSGQLQYTSPNAAGFTSLTFSFRATVTH